MPVETSGRASEREREKEREREIEKEEKEKEKPVSIVHSRPGMTPEYQSEGTQ